MLRRRKEEVPFVIDSVIREVTEVEAETTIDEDFKDTNGDLRKEMVRLFKGNGGKEEASRPEKELERESREEAEFAPQPAYGELTRNDIVALFGGDPEAAKRAESFDFEEAERRLRLNPETAERFQDGILAIGPNTFAGMSLRKVKIPDKVFYIGPHAFAWCAELETVTLPERLERIEAGTFEGAGLVYVAIPQNVKNIDEDAFSTCPWLERVAIPPSVEEIGERAFFRLESLRALIFLRPEESKLRRLHRMCFGDAPQKIRDRRYELLPRAYSRPSEEVSRPTTSSDIALEITGAFLIIYERKERRRGLFGGSRWISKYN